MEGTLPARIRQTKYQPLIDYLAAQAVQDVTLSLTEIEAIIGVPLSVSAWNDPPTWHSTSQTHVRRWQEMGWHARLARRNHSVHFTRVPGIAARPLRF